MRIGGRWLLLNAPIRLSLSRYDKPLIQELQVVRRGLLTVKPHHLVRATNARVVLPNAAHGRLHIVTVRLGDCRELEYLQGDGDRYLLLSSRTHVARGKEQVEILLGILPERFHL